MGPGEDALRDAMHALTKLGSYFRLRSGTSNIELSIDFQNRQR